MSEPLVWLKSSYSDTEGSACIEVALTWHKSTHSDTEGDNCIEIAWRKSTHSHAESDTCIEFASTPEAIRVRDSKDPSGPHLTFTTAAWAAFTAFAATHPV